MDMLYKVEVVKKNRHFNELKNVWDMHSGDDLIVFIEDNNEHAGRHIEGIDGVYCGYGVGQKLEGCY